MAILAVGRRRSRLAEIDAWRVGRRATLGALVLLVLLLGPQAPAGDTLAYYNAHLPNLYDGSAVGTQTYPYSPAFAMAIAPLQALPIQVMRTLTFGAEVAGFAYLIGPGWALAAMFFMFPTVWASAMGGNLQLAATALLVFSLRHPAAWAGLLLSKLTPGIGVLWHAFRSEWRAFCVAVGTTATVAAISFALAPSAWFDWARFLARSPDTGDAMALPFVLRLAIAVAAIALAARTDRIWLVPIAAAAASPEGGGHWNLVLGAIPLLRDQIQAQLNSSGSSRTA